MLEIHNTSKILFKKPKYIFVDSKIAPVVAWLNSFDGIRTEWSCEGGAIQKPYIIFYSSNATSLIIVLEIVSSVIKKCDSCEDINVNIENYYGELRYSMTFKDMNVLKIFKRHINSKRVC